MWPTCVQPWQYTCSVCFTSLGRGEACTHLCIESNCCKLTWVLWTAAGVCRRALVPGVHVWRHDEDKDVALQHQTTPWTHPPQYTGHACECTHWQHVVHWCIQWCLCVSLRFEISPLLTFQAQDPQMLDQLSKNITRCGLSNSTLNYLRVSEAQIQNFTSRATLLLNVFFPSRWLKDNCIT